MTGEITGTGGTWNWYTISCGGTAAGNGTTITVSPTVTTEYYLRGEGDCLTTNCMTITITVVDSSHIGTITATKDTICNGDSTVIIATGILGTNGNWHWYSGSCGGSSIGQGSTVTESPVLTTSYYVRIEGTVNTTNCVNTTIVVNTLTTQPSAATADNYTIHIGDTDTIRITGGLLGTGGIWRWYTGGCGMTQIGTGIKQFIAPTQTTDYYVRGEGECNTTGCKSVEVYVIPGYTLSGTVKYDNTIIDPDRFSMDKLTVERDNNRFNAGRYHVGITSSAWYSLGHTH